MHSNAPGDMVAATVVIRNTVSGDTPFGIFVSTEAPTAAIFATAVVANQICNEVVPIYRHGDVGTLLKANTICGTLN